MKVLILGASGLVGNKLLEQALNNPQISQVIAPTRKALKSHPKLISPLINFDELAKLANEDWWQVDAIICALGTTIKKAKSKEAFYKIDHDYPFEAARIAKNKGVEVFVLNSAAGANAQSNVFYNKVKGQIEDDLKKLNFKSLTIARPGLIGGDREESRPLEFFAKKMTTILHPILPKKFHLNPPENIAREMLKAAIEKKAGLHILSTEQFI